MAIYQLRDQIVQSIEINRSIIDHGIHEISDNKMRAQEYNEHIKPLLDDYETSHGHSPAGLIKILLDKNNILMDQRPSFRRSTSVSVFSNWGRVVKPYVWGCIYLHNEEGQPYSKSPQLYLSISPQGLSYGFCYGDRVDNQHEHVVKSKKDTQLQNWVAKTVQELELSVRRGDHYDDLLNDAQIDNLELPASWECGIYIIRNWRWDQLPSDDTLIEDIAFTLGKLSFLLDYKSSMWLYQPGRGAEFWDDDIQNGMMQINFAAKTDLSSFKSRRALDTYVSENNLGGSNVSKALWEFTHELKDGDIIFAKSGRNFYSGYGIVHSAYFYDNENSGGRHVRKVQWIKTGNWELEKDRVLPIKTLTNISQYESWEERLRSRFNLVDAEEAKGSPPGFDPAALLDDVFVDSELIDSTIRLLQRKKNIILTGPAGVGKTFIAKKLAYLLQREVSDERIAMVQFHQSFSYEDFIQGYRPTEQSFQIKNGLFLEISRRAQNDPTKPYFLIIDEINRGNLSKIFGELMLLIESDKRGPKYAISLTYSKNGELFYIPENLYLIGTMNTADRSLAIIDYALRRRFAFIPLKPHFGDGLRDYMNKMSVDPQIIDKIITKMTRLNETIYQSPSLGPGFEIGHSFFCTFHNGDCNEWYEEILKFEILPLIEEYWFDDPDECNAQTSFLLG